MARTHVPGSQVTDGSLQRIDMDIETPGQAMITRLAAGSGIVLEETGEDTGTGEVTVGLTAAAELDKQRVDATLTSAVPDSGLLSLGTSKDVLFSLCGFVITDAAHIHQAGLVVSQVDNDRSFTLGIYSDPTGTPILVYPLVVLPVSTRIVYTGALELDITPGEYGLFLQRTTGSGKAKFKFGYGMVAFG